MIEKIYTIPLSEALEAGGECLLCTIEEKVTSSVLKFYNGPAMMEPDTRIETNEKGFCAYHYARMLKEGEKLALALVLQTRLKEVYARLENACGVKNSRFSKPSRKAGVDNILAESFAGCSACGRIDGLMDKYYKNFIFLLKTEKDFGEGFFNSKGLCMKHFAKVILLLKDGELFEKMLVLQKSGIDRIIGEIDRFVLKHDYKNGDLPWNNSEDSPERAVKKLRGII